MDGPDVLLQLSPSCKGGLASLPRALEGLFLPMHRLHVVLQVIPLLEGETALRTGVRPSALMNGLDVSSKRALLSEIRGAKITFVPLLRLGRFVVRFELGF